MAMNLTKTAAQIIMSGALGNLGLSTAEERFMRQLRKHERKQQEAARAPHQGKKEAARRLRQLAKREAKLGDLL